jgi:hypothetical protein
LNLAAAKKRGHIIHQRHLNTHNTNTITTRDSGEIFVFVFLSVCLSLDYFFSSRWRKETWASTFNNCQHLDGRNITWLDMARDENSKRKKNTHTHATTHIEKSQSRPQDVKSVKRVSE